MNDRLLRALRREPTDRTPVWFMRQAGRCLPRYRELRAEETFLDLVGDPEAAAAVTALPLEYFPVDALVLFMDLSTPFQAAGLEVEMRPGVGPVVLAPWSGPEDVDRLRGFDPRDTLDHVLEAIRILVGREGVPIIGFVGAPFTLCSYLLPGSRVSRLNAIRALVRGRPRLWDRLAGFWAEHLAEFGIAQHEAGASAVQVFDSWVGVLDPDTYRERVLPHTRRLFERLEAAGVPSIHFGTGNPALLPVLAEAGGTAIGLDWRLPIDRAWEAVGAERAVQGNLDPAAILAGEAAALAATDDILRRVGRRPGHVFNVGHGLDPSSDPDVVRAVVERVHAFEPRDADA